MYGQVQFPITPLKRGGFSLTGGQFRGPLRFPDAEAAVSQLMWDADDSTLMWNADDTTLMWGTAPGESPIMWGTPGDNMWSATDTDLMWTPV